MTAQNHITGTALKFCRAQPYRFLIGERIELLLRLSCP